MAYEPSMALKDAARIFKKVRQKTYAATLQTLQRAATDIITNLNTYRKWGHVTGNAWTSATVGVFYKGNLVSLVSEADRDDPPVRKTLKKGEKYYGPFYHDEFNGNFYLGQYGQGGQWGPTLGPWHMRRRHSAKSNTWELVVMIPVSYAGFNNDIVESIQHVMEDLPNIVGRDIVSVEWAMESGLPF